MRWDQQRQSDNVEDRRGVRLGGGMGRGVGGLGIGGLLVLMVLGYLVGGDPLALLRDSGAPAQVDQSQPGEAGPAPTDEAGKFIRAVLGSTEDVWTAQFQQQLNKRYQAPRLVLFSEAVQSACGTASSAVGPFYCPPDQQVYIDLSFYRELDRRFGAPGDFAQAYVIAHEVGHHVQNLLGLAARIDAQRQSSSEAQANALSVRQELQADCYAGVWGFFVDKAQSGIKLEPGDVEEGLAAAAAIGDDRLQKGTQGSVTPETWTHGSSDQRVRWLRRGLSSGRIADCDTFAGQS
jgi:predicted metalloprotease